VPLALLRPHLTLRRTGTRHELGIQ
jgi:hypothetical protein